jgi:hypothetical protein
VSRDNVPTDESKLTKGAIMYIFLTIKKGSKEYTAVVSSFSYQGRDLWLYVWQDDKTGVKGNCGYIPNGKVISASASVVSNPYISKETLEILRVW